MSWLKAIVSQVFGLFVDDGSFALAIVAWLGIAALMLTRLDLPTGANAVILTIGLLAILFESVVRRAGR